MSSGFTWHGGRLAEARALFGAAENAWIDLSTGINPIGWPGAPAAKVDWQTLPDPLALTELEVTAAGYFGVDPAHCCAVPGSEIGLRLLAPILDLPARYLTPTYRTHAEAFPQAQPIGALDQPPAEPSVLLLANPNNPDGRIVPPGQLQQWLGWMEASGGWLVVDEAFADARPECSIASQIADGRRLIVLRSLGKFFGLAGLRLGFVLAPRAVIAAYRQLVGEWPVSNAALAFGRHAYRDTDWIAATQQALPQRAKQLDAVLVGHGYVPVGDCPLFRLIELPNAHALFTRLARRAILTRPFSDYPRWLRLGLPADEKQLARLDEALGDG